ncbi:MAG: ATP-binding cassette domain-containing protein [Desulfofustis sp.]|jgi:ABC-2 type transport system ATP-binding protein|nr:ATP-binding cassette domain-containing protein [Desulfofustis sp.]
MMIQVDSITRAYGDFLAVDQVSFAISPGEIVGLLGHNGAGKTTVMKMMTGFLEPTGGTITIDGLDVIRNRREVQQLIGYLPENCPVYPDMTVIDYLDYAAALRGLDERQRPRLLAETITRTGLQEKAGHSIATLSRGYRQRTGVAQAILGKPKLLILDEPTNGLDPTQIQEMRSLISALASRATVLISTHILQEVQAVCNRVIILKDGKKALDARLDELQRSKRLLVSTDQPAEKVLTTLATLPELTAVEAVQPDPQLPNSHRFALSPAQHDRPQETAAVVAQTIQHHGWHLFSLHFETRTLETVFADISVPKGGK